MSEAEQACANCGAVLETATTPSPATLGGRCDRCRDTIRTIRGLERGDRVHVELGLTNGGCYAGTVAALRHVDEQANPRVDHEATHTVHLREIAIEGREGYDVTVPLTIDRHEGVWLDPRSDALPVARVEVIHREGEDA